jgi:hypothetical protein
MGRKKKRTDSISSSIYNPSIKLEEDYMNAVTSSKLLTSLAHKHYEPLILRRYVTKWGVPVFIGLICGDDLSNLDELIDVYQSEYSMPENLQGIRNWVGRLSDFICKSYNRVEAVAVVLYADKVAVSSLYGDFMNHPMCRQELYSLLNWMSTV